MKEQALESSDDRQLSKWWAGRLQVLGGEEQGPWDPKQVLG